MSDAAPTPEAPTPGTRRSAAKRDAILRAALTVFLREGFAGASVDAVAATAGVGKQTVYAHFGDKEKLFIAAAESANRANRPPEPDTPHQPAPHDPDAPNPPDTPGRPNPSDPPDGPNPSDREDPAATASAWRSPLPATGDPRADLAAAGVRVLRAVLDPQTAALHRMTIAELTRHPELQRLWRDSVSRQVVDDLAAYLADRDRAGELSVPDPRLAARQFVLLLAADGRVRSLHGAQPLPDDEYARIADETADLIVRAHHRHPDGGRDPHTG